MPRNWKLLRTIVAVSTKAWTICAKCSKRKLTFMISDQDKRLQVLAPNVATGKRPMLLQQIRGRPMTSDFKMIIGDERSTSLPENTFDKILIINSFHEFTYQAEMLADIKKKLKAGASFTLMRHYQKDKDNYMVSAIYPCLQMKKPLLYLKRMVLNISTG